MMKKEYLTPSYELLYLEADVITSSGKPNPPADDEEETAAKKDPSYELGGVPL